MSSSHKTDAFKIRNHHAWLSFTIYILSVAIITLLLLACTQMLISYIIEDKVQSRMEEYDTARSIIEHNGPDSLDHLEPNFFITDADGRIVTSRGTDTCDISEREFIFQSSSSLTEELSDDEEPVIPVDDTHGLYFLKDNECDYLYVDDEQVHLRVLRFLRSDDLKDMLKSDEGKISFPFWLSSTDDDGNTLYYRSEIIIKSHDVIMMLLMLLIVAGIFIIMFTFLLIMVIRNIRDRKKMTRLIFLDDISGNRNWMWYLNKGRSILRKKRNAGHNYAVINLVFVNYRHFALCHSLEEGKEVLRSIYNVLAASCAKNEIAAHSTSSNFPMLLTCKDAEDIKARLNDIISRLENIEDDHKFGFHAGVSIIGTETDSKGEAKSRKDIDLDLEYNNASAARMTLEGSDDSGIAFFDQEFVEQQKWIDTVNECSQTALDNEEFVIYYQPKYDPKTDSLRGAEALIRWISPKFGFVSPGKFIPIFEKNGFITRIDHYMIRGVARAQKAWLDKGFACVPISVNVSRAHFIEADLAEQILDLVDREECPHELIEIELTESAFFDDQKSLLRTINKLKEYGFHVSMDDFGSGYSSLNTLKDIPLDVLKLDAGFFRGTSEDGRGKIVVSEAISLARKLNMKTVAEGVEDKDQVDFLASEGCDMIQGYYYAKPMPAEEFESRMT